MHRVWLVLNPAAGSAGATTGDDLRRSIAQVGLELAGATETPREALPSAFDLSTAGCDTLVIYGGDGTIATVTAALDDWDGSCLVLPGGTMNLLPTQLHGAAPWQDVLDRALTSADAVRLPVASAEGHRALVGVIVGPAAGWIHARERLRAGQLLRLGRALRFAWRRTFSRSVRVVGGAHPGRHRAVIITPLEARLEVASVRSETWMDVARIGWEWLAGDWRKAPGVDVSLTPSARIMGGRTLPALFDGEPARLKNRAEIRHGSTRLRFIVTAPR